MMETTIVSYIVMGFIITVNAQTTTTSYPTMFMNYTIDYEDFNITDCIATITTSTTTSSSTTTTTTTSTTTLTTTSTKTTSTTSTTTTTTSTTSTTTTSTTTTTTLTSTSTTTMSTVAPSVFTPVVCANQTMGSSCNISSDPCSLAQPCLNAATCYPNSSIPVGYSCACVSIFYSGINCENDLRVCQPNVSCLNGGFCDENATVLICQCPTGKTGTYCEAEVDICGNIDCKNNARCISKYGNWSCLCINTDYSGTYCETKSSSLTVKETFSRSFSAVAIGCISTVIAFFLIMDILKYCFNIDPIDNSVRFRRTRYPHRHKHRSRKTPISVIERPQYIDG